MSRQVDLLAHLHLADLYRLISTFPPKLREEDYFFVRPVLKSFNANVDRVSGILINGPANTQFGMMCATAMALASLEATKNRGKPSVRWWDDLTPGQRILADKNLSNYYDELRSIVMTSGLNEISGKSRMVWENLLANGDPKVLAGFEATISASVIGAWTAFEVLAGDLWEHTINERLELAFVGKDVNPLPTDDAEKIEKKRKASIKILLEQVRKPTFNLRQQMGTILRQGNDFDFQSWYSARDAFLAIFPKEKGKLTNIFGAPVVRWLAATRNVLVHKGGVPDKEFLSQVGDNSLLCASNECVSLGGKVASELILGIITKGTELLTFVDEWAKNNPVNE